MSSSSQTPAVLCHLLHHLVQQLIVAGLRSRPGQAQLPGLGLALSALVWVSKGSRTVYN